MRRATFVAALGCRHDRPKKGKRKEKPKAAVLFSRRSTAALGSTRDNGRRTPLLLTPLSPAGAAAFVRNNR